MNRKTSFSPKVSQQPKMEPVKDIKGKGKLVSHPEVHTKKTLANPTTLKTSLKENQSKKTKSTSDKPKQENNKIKGFTIKRKR